MLGTLFDTLVHAVNAYLLSLYISSSAALIAMGVDICLAALLFFSARLAWSSPSNVPEWVMKRVQQVKEDKYSYPALIETLHIGIFFAGVGLIYNFLA